MLVWETFSTEQWIRETFAYCAAQTPKIRLGNTSAIQDSYLHMPLWNIKLETEMHGFTGSYTVQLCAFGRHQNL
jgi:hypothetical protein